METNKLPEDFKKKWIEALRSGKFKQGNERLFNKRDNSFCCLGVACAIAYKTLPKWVKKDTIVGSHNGSINYFIARNIPLVIQGTAQQNDIVLTLTGMNDSGKSFSEIADYIEANL